MPQYQIVSAVEVPVPSQTFTDGKGNKHTQADSGKTIPPAPPVNQPPVIVPPAAIPVGAVLNTIMWDGKSPLTPPDGTKLVLVPGT